MNQLITGEPPPCGMSIGHVTQALSRAIRLFMALDLTPDLDIFVSPNIYAARRVTYPA